MEEAASGVADPALRTIYSGKQYGSLGEYLDDVDVPKLRYDMLLGGLLGGIGSAAKNPLRQTALPDTIRAETNSSKNGGVVNGGEQGSIRPTAAINARGDFGASAKNGNRPSAQNAV
ncbi:MAG: hypothetical protein E7474_13280 [Ruminococcaceae bacterium]|nr:hypothetical protein [Oscillospiraceae bacterium]